jgi:hypothetical protein
MVDRQERVDPRLAIDDEVLALITQVRVARRHVLLTVTALGVQQERFKPGADEWSIANVVEHLVLAEQAGIHRLWQAAAGLRCGQEAWNGTVPHRMLSIEEVVEQTWKVTSTGPISVRTAEKAPEAATPRSDGPLADWATCLEACQPVLEQLGEVLSGLDLAQVIVPHVTSGPLDARQRLQFLHWHLDHHRQQIEDIKACPGFPTDGPAGTHP